MADQIDIDNLVNQLREATVAMNRLGGTAATGSAGSKDINRLVQALARLGEKFDRTAKSQKQRDQDIQDFIDEVDSAAKSIEDLDAAAREQARAAADLAAELEKAARRANLSSEQLAAEEARDRKAARNKQARAELEQLRAKQAKEVNYSALLARARLDEIAQTKTLQARLENLGDTITDRFGTDAVKTQVAMIRLQGAIKKVQESATQLGSAFVRGVGDIAMSMGSFATDIGDGAKSFTQFNGLIDSVTNALGEMAKAIPFAGEAISGAMKLTAEGAKFVLDQLQQTADSFNELGSVGALTAGGLTEFRQAQIDTGVSLEVFKKAIAENSTTLARFSGTVGSGAQRFTKVLTPLTKQGSETSAELRRLGFTLGDISEATGNYIGLQTRLGRAQRKSNEELSQGAAQYAKELDLLAKLTGKSRKDLQAQQEAALSEGRFRAVVDELAQAGPAGEKAAKELLDFQSRVESVSPELASAIRDVSTGFTNSEAAVKGFNSTSGQLGPIIDQLKSGAISQDEAYRRLQTSLGSNIETQREFAKAMGDDGPFIRLNEALDLLRGEAQDGAKALGDQAAQTKPGTDALTDSTVTAQQGMEQLSIQIQELGFQAMPQATKAINAFTDTLNEFLSVISDKLGLEGLAQQKEPSTEEIEKLNDTTKAIGDAVDIAVDPTKMIADAESREEAIQRQQDANYKLATTTEKAGILLGEAINDTAEIIGSGFDLIGLDRVGQTFTALGKSGREARVASQVETLKDTGRMPAGGAGAAAKPAAPAGGAKGGQPPAVRGGAGGPPTGAITPDQLFNFGSGTGSQAHFEKLDPGFRQALVSMAQEYNLQTGQKLNLNSAFRSIEEQASINPGANPKAQPGRSKHNFGMAADLNSKEVQALAQMGLLSKYGFKTLANDPPHIYMRDGGVIPARQGGTRVVAGEAGQNEAFVPLPDGKNIPVEMKGAYRAPTADQIRKAYGMGDSLSNTSMIPGLNIQDEESWSIDPMSVAGKLDQAYQEMLAIDRDFRREVETLRDRSGGAITAADYLSFLMRTPEGKVWAAQNAFGQNTSEFQQRGENKRLSDQYAAILQQLGEQSFDAQMTQMRDGAKQIGFDAGYGIIRDALSGMEVLQGDMRSREALRKLPQMAEGGITQGPSIVGEAGPEAVLPIGKVLPVTLKPNPFPQLQTVFTDSFAGFTQQQTSVGDVFQDVTAAFADSFAGFTQQQTSVGDVFQDVTAAFADVNGTVQNLAATAQDLDIEALDAQFIDSAFKELTSQVKAVDLDGTDMIGEMISRPMQAFADISTAGLGGMLDNPAAMTGMTAPAQSLITPNVTSALTDIENVFAKAGMTPGSTPTAAAAAPALGAAPEMAAGGMAEMMSQLTKLVDLQSRSNKISEKLVRVSTN